VLPKLKFVVVGLNCVKINLGTKIIYKPKYSEQLTNQAFLN